MSFPCFSIARVDSTLFFGSKNMERARSILGSSLTKGMSRIIRFRGFGERRRTDGIRGGADADAGRRRRRRRRRQAWYTAGDLDPRPRLPLVRSLVDMCRSSSPSIHTPANPTLPCPTSPRPAPYILRSMRRDVAFPTNPNFSPPPFLASKVNTLPFWFFFFFYFILYHLFVIISIRWINSLFASSSLSSLIGRVRLSKFGKVGRRNVGEGSGRDYPRRERSSIDSFRSSSSTSTSTTTTQYPPLTCLVRALYRFHRSLPRLRLRFTTNFEKKDGVISWIRILRNILFPIDVASYKFLCIGSKKKKRKKIGLSLFHR